MSIWTAFTLIIAIAVCIALIGILDEYLEPKIGKSRFFVIPFVSSGLSILSIYLIL